MAEVRKITCDMCGRDIQSGYVVASTNRRRISSGSPDRGAYRFDLCDACFNTIKEACWEKREEGQCRK